MPRPARRRGAVTLVAVLMATGCVVFAAVNVYFEVTDQFGDGPYVAYAYGISVVNWLVVVLKLVGAAVALLSVSPRPLGAPPLLLGVALRVSFRPSACTAWAASCRLPPWPPGSPGRAEDFGLDGLGYVLGFLAAAAGFGVLAVSYSRRHRLPPADHDHRRRTGRTGDDRPGAGRVPALLVALGVMPDY